jgi:hypothetical protein
MATRTTCTLALPQGGEGRRRARRRCAHCVAASQSSVILSRRCCTGGYGRLRPPPQHASIGAGYSGSRACSRWSFSQAPPLRLTLAAESETISPQPHSQLKPYSCSRPPGSSSASRQICMFKALAVPVFTSCPASLRAGAGVRSRRPVRHRALRLFCEQAPQRARTKIIAHTMLLLPSLDRWFTRTLHRPARTRGCRRSRCRDPQVERGPASGRRPPPDGHTADARSGLHFVGGAPRNPQG